MQEGKMALFMKGRHYAGREGGTMHEGKVALYFMKGRWHHAGREGGIMQEGTVASCRKGR